MSRTKVLHTCSGCGQQLAQWAGRCPGCGAWGTVEERQVPASAGRSRSGLGASGGAVLPLLSLVAAEGAGRRTSTGFAGVDRVLGGGLVPASVVLLAGEPGIGKSTLLLQLVSNLSAAGLTCLLASGEESADQVAARAARLAIPPGTVSFMSGRDLPDVIETARAHRPFLLAVDSIQTIRYPDATSLPGGPGQVRSCADALVGLAKTEGIAVLVTGHVTKDGDLAGPRTLEHAVDVVLSFEGDARTGLRTLAGGKNRFGPEGEVAWFEMGRDGLHETDGTGTLAPGHGEAGSALALTMAGRRALAVEVQALAVPTEGPPRRQASGLDLRRFSLIAAVLDRSTRLPLFRTELFGAAAGGVRLDDPGTDLAVAAAMASAVSGAAPPAHSAFVGEVSLTGQVRPVPGLEQRIAAAANRGVRRVFVPAGAGGMGGPRGGGDAPGAGPPGGSASPEIVEVRAVSDALGWALQDRPPGTSGRPSSRSPGGGRGTGRRSQEPAETGI